MEDSFSDACLPPGWTVKVNVRKNGKKDKYYFPPSSDLKFNSIVGVFRYLNNAKNKACIQRVSDKKSDQQIPRRASKRLAGIRADPLLELKPTRARRDVPKQSGDKAGIYEDRPTNSLLNDQMKQLNTVEGKETMFTVKSTENIMDNSATDEECVKVIENKDDIDVKLDYTDEFPLKEILTDPCIAFAIKTLIGNTFETFKDTQTSDSAEECGKKTNVTNNNLKKTSVAENDKAVNKTRACSEKKNDKSKMELSSGKLCKSDYNCSQMFGDERRNVC